MKKFTIYSMVLVLLLSLSCTCVFAAEGMENFKATQEYDDRFVDVPSSIWFYKFVKSAYEYGFVSGKTDKTFDPDGNITLAETLVIADQINSIYYGREVERTSSNPWFKPYVDYAVNNGIISASDYSDYTAKATRLQFASIMAKALPDAALPAIGNITSIPDVPQTMAKAEYVYKLYNAGIISGSDEYGTFKPSSNIKRSEVSVIAINMADQSRRSAATLKPVPTEQKPQEKPANNDPSLIYDSNGIKVTYKGLTEDKTWKTHVINLEIVNNSKDDISYAVSHIKVNGFSIDALAFADIYSGAKATAQIGFAKSDIALANINPIKEMLFDLKLENKNTDDVIDVVPVSIKTSAYDGKESPFVFTNGTEVYKGNGLTLFARPNDKTSVRHPLTFYVINDTDRAVALNYDNVAYNDEMVMSMHSGPYIMPHSKKVFDMAIYFFDPLEITEINKVKMAFTVCPYRNDGSFTSADFYDTPAFTIGL